MDSTTMAAIPEGHTLVVTVDSGGEAEYGNGLFRIVHVEARDSSQGQLLGDAVLAESGIDLSQLPDWAIQAAEALRSGESHLLS